MCLGLDMFFKVLFSLPHTTNRTVSEPQKVEAESFPVEHGLSPTAERPDGFRFVSCPSVSAPHSQDRQPHLNESTKKKKEIL